MRWRDLTDLHVESLRTQRMQAILSYFNPSTSWSILISIIQNQSFIPVYSNLLGGLLSNTVALFISSVAYKEL